MQTYGNIVIESLGELTSRVESSGDEDQGLRVYLVAGERGWTLYATEWPGARPGSYGGRVGITPEQFAARLRELADSIDAKAARLRVESQHVAQLVAVPA